MGLEAAIEALEKLQRIQALNASWPQIAAQVDEVIRTVRRKGRDTRSPLLIGLADALDDALIVSAPKTPQTD